MGFERVCQVADIDSEQPYAATIGPYNVAIARAECDDGEEEIFAFQDLCSHQAVALSEGEVYDCVVECWLHGSQFDLRTGKALNLPATEPISTFPVDIRGEDVFVDTTTTLNGVTPT